MLKQLHKPFALWLLCKTTVGSHESTCFDLRGVQHACNISEGAHFTLDKITQAAPSRCNLPAIKAKGNC